MSDKLFAAAAEIDVMDAAGVILANPRRNATAAPVAVVLALAMATERFWEICIEAELLVRALEFPVIGTDENASTRNFAIRHQAVRVTQLMTALRGEPNEEKGNGSSHS
ncbi:hypothetical protein ASD44_09810 [Mesorhizobium sp. Root554]|uniref:hypothetical protein n=1 Tax=unclassified Mesorhizobium TaxID=325217 RepID=UPI0006F2AE67|nr:MULTISPECIES: hypothetical protein [unclassified Mesorhizobium]KQZ14334.1 hypothetical protein ASD27_09820 [Mesorhizobium sp. Root1471]KQZ36845.1 hypothetical protein ASD44_09810 [Mesorhizobium sp. Root554]